MLIAELSATPMLLPEDDRPASPGSGVSAAFDEALLTQLHLDYLLVRRHQLSRHGRSRHGLLHHWLLRHYLVL